MDNLTHTLTGVALARMGLEKRVPGATLTLALSSNLPDIDILSGFFGTVAYLDYHRAITHAFPASLILAAPLALILTRWPRSERRFLPTLFLSWLGVFLHIVWDLWTSYGTRVFLPFDATWYSWDWMFIVDPVFLGLLALACFGTRLLGSSWWPRRAGAAALAYIGLRALVSWLALGQAQSFAGSEFTNVRVIPSPLALNHWRILASNDSTFLTGSVQAIGTSRSRVAFQRTPLTDPARRIAIESRAARSFLAFSEFPRFESKREGDLTVLIWRDLRFATQRMDGFFCEVKVDDSGRIVAERIVF